MRPVSPPFTPSYNVTPFLLDFIFNLKCENEINCGNSFEIEYRGSPIARSVIFLHIRIERSNAHLWTPKAYIHTDFPLGYEGSKVTVYTLISQDRT
jgi:hypothetical protein